MSLATLATLAADAHAEPRGFAVNRFEPSERGSDWLTADGLDLRGHLRPAFGVALDWAYRPLVIYEPSGVVRASLVRNQIAVHPGASLVLADRVRLALDLPIQAYADGHAGTLDGVAYPAPAHATSFGDVRLGADVRLAGTYGDAFTLALGARAWLPTGAASSYAGDGAFRFAPHVAVAGTAGLFTYAADAGLALRAREDRFGDAPLGSEVTFGGAAGLRLGAGRIVVGPEVFGATRTGDPFATRTTPIEALLGAHVAVAAGVRAGASVGTGLTRGYGAPAFRSAFVVEWFAGVEPPVAPHFDDRDHDRIVDLFDACPDVPGVHDDDPARDGCPPADRDRDGVVDLDDVCPEVPGVATSDVRTNGCPSDRDGDRFADTDDACPDEPGVASEDPRRNGCPRDRDRDGIADKDDACPELAGPRTTDPKTSGCPDADRDSDGVPNEVDACPDAAGPVDRDPKRSGCPKAYVAGRAIAILDDVRFKSGRAELLRDKGNDDVLAAIARLLVAHPEIRRVRVGVRVTELRGDAGVALGARRAAAVVAWLVAHGVDAGRLRSESASARPDANATDEAGRNYRHLELHIEEPASLDAPSRE